MKEQTTGIVLMAFGKRGYYYMAYNLAFSLKRFNPNIPIHLITDSKQSVSKNLGGKVTYFDVITEVEREDVFNKGVFDPGLAKISLYKYLGFDHNIYLDVDAIAIKDIQPLVDKLINSGADYLSQCVGYHTIDKGDFIPSMQWAKANLVWKHFELDEKAVLPAINSSIAYIKKGDKAMRLYEVAKQFYLNPIPLKDLSMMWGGTQPDELYMNAALAYVGIDPSIGEIVIHFETHRNRTFAQVIEQFYFQGYYGGRGFTHKMYTQWIDDLLRNWHYEIKENHTFNMPFLLSDKHANKR